MIDERLKDIANAWTAIIKDLSHNEMEQLERIKQNGKYSSTVHNDSTKALESLIKKGYPIKRTIENKYLMVFTYGN
jgi:hypothetical protein